MKIIFKGEEYLFVGRGNSLQEGGMLVRKDEDDELDVAYAQLHPNGLVIRDNEIIGTVREILLVDDESEEIN